jgi:hypothetical protein
MKQITRFAILTTLLVGSAYAASQRYGALYTFECNGSQFQRSGPCPDGGRPDSLIRGSDGNFYGVAQVSMEGDSAPNGGTVFSLTPSRKLKVLYTFAPGPNSDYPNGNLPGGLTEGPDGKLYGETFYGGIGGCNGYCGAGLLYRVNRDGSNFEVIHEYCSEPNCADGEFGGVLVVGSDHNIYGTTSSGGANVCEGYPCGTIFRVTPSTGKYEVVLNFDETTGGEPSSLIVAPDHTFWGTLAVSAQGEALFHYTEATERLQSASMHFPLVHGLPSDGGMLTLGPNGNFYGVYHVYAMSGAGLFEIHPDATDLQLFPFYTTQDGAGSPQTMLLASDNNFWIADYNGADGYGDIITLSPSNGSLIQRFSIFSSTDAVGAYPADLIQLQDGTLWGTTMQYGHASNGQFPDGAVFGVSVGWPHR